MKGDIFGETKTLSPGPREVYAKALTRSVIYQIDGQVFKNILLSNPEIALKVLEWSSSRLKDTEDLLEKIAFGDAKTRLLYQLLKLCDNFGIDEEGYCKLRIKLTHQDLANMIAVSRETVTNTINLLSKEGIVIASNRQFKIKCQAIRKQLLNLTPL